MSSRNLTTTQTRDFETRAAASQDAAARTVEGVAVPFNRPITVRSWGETWQEQFTAETIFDGADIAKLAWRHDEIIGALTSSASKPDGLHIAARISETSTGDDAYTLAVDGVVDRFSIGFLPVEYSVTETGDGSDLITYTRVQLFEVSLVPWPAYDDATVDQVRARQNPIDSDAEGAPVTTRESESQVTDVIERADLDALSEDIERRMAVAMAAARTPEAPAIDRRSAGEVLKALATGSETEVRSYEETLKRAYAGGTSADTTNNPGWVGDLSRIYDASSGVLAAIFETEAAPAEGDVVSYTTISANTLAVNAHTEGAELTPGKITFTPGNASILTYAGLAQLTLREIERSSVQVLNKTIQGLTIAAAQKEKAVLRTAFGAAITAQTTAEKNVDIAHALASSTVADWTGAIVDAAVKFDAVALGLTGLVVDAMIYKYLAQLEDGNGRLVFDSSGGANGSVGTLALPSLSGNLAGVKVVLDPGAAAGVASFVNSSAITRYLTPLVQLTQTNIVNLSQGTAVYRYGVPIATVPEGIVPLTFSAE